MFSNINLSEKCLRASQVIALILKLKFQLTQFDANHSRALKLINMFNRYNGHKLK